jgi:hypothetical protein
VTLAQSAGGTNRMNLNEIELAKRAVMLAQFKLKLSFLD